MDLSLIIPAYNEASRIERSLQAGLDYFAGVEYSWEILVVDDGSTDDTVTRVTDFEGVGVRLISLDKNRGKGAAVRRGMLEATGKKRIFTDADFSTPIDEVTPMLEHLDQYDIAIGSRAVDRSRVEVHQPWYRETMGKIFNLFVQRIAVSGIKDTQCGFKGFRSGAAEEVFSRSMIDGFSFDVEALYIARRLGYSILEFPVRWINDDRSTVNPITDSIRMFGELMKIRRLHVGLGSHQTGSSVLKQ